MTTLSTWLLTQVRHGCRLMSRTLHWAVPCVFMLIFLVYQQYFTVYTAGSLGREQEQQNQNQRVNNEYCSVEGRAKLLEKTCQTERDNLPRENNTRGQKETLHIVILDHDRRLFYCLIGKVGSKSMLRYLASSKNASTKGIRHNEQLSTFGMERVNQMPLTDAKENYKDFQKFIVVRHPLQRVTSAYYEIIVRKFNNNAVQYPTPSGRMMNFTEFVDHVTSDQTDMNAHWKRYAKRCKVCSVKYQHVLRSESMRRDVAEFSSTNQLGGKLEFTHHNPFINKSEHEQNFKYDVMLRQLQLERPDLMRRLLDVYNIDMTLFGYRWNWTETQSSCRRVNQDGTCC